jgi:hypothetical protein
VWEIFARVRQNSSGEKLGGQAGMTKTAMALYGQGFLS